MVHVKELNYDELKASTYPINNWKGHSPITFSASIRCKIHLPATIKYVR